jgi:hypothetical protein
MVNSIPLRHPQVHLRVVGFYQLLQVPKFVNHVGLLNRGVFLHVIAIFRAFSEERTQLWMCSVCQTGLLVFMWSQQQHFCIICFEVGQFSGWLSPVIWKYPFCGRETACNTWRFQYLKSSCVHESTEMSLFQGEEAVRQAYRHEDLACYIVRPGCLLNSVGWCSRSYNWAG